MGSPTENLAKAKSLPEGDVIRILLEQHARVQTLFSQLKMATGESRQDLFDELRALLAVHETAEEMVLRPVTKKVAGESVADARNQEEEQANEVLAELEDLDVASPEFATKLAAFEQSVLSHAEAEEQQEFPAVLAECDAEERQKLGKRLERTEKIAPTHPHPTTAGSTAKQYMVGPFASIVDRVKDSLSRD
ncbi:MAG TPA: hemerythrin domain-containing protein [Actinomycetales bacterium]|nr:hemerythrin domain-containing protein [Actinomycetales bacterium]